MVIRFQKVGSKCYKSYITVFRKRRKTWKQARDTCIAMGGPGNPGHADLLSIHSKTQLDNFRARILPFWVPGNIWIGLNDRNRENK